MKRNLLSILTLLVSSLFIFISCNEDDTATSINPDSIVRFETGEPVIEISEESDEIIEIPVYINKEADGPVTVLYEVVGDEANYEMISEYGKAVIPAGQRTGVILMQAVGNDTQDDPVNSVIVRITGSDTSFEVPNEVAIGYAEKIVTFLDDECPVDIESFEGTYSVQEGFYDGVNAGLTLAGAFDESYQLEISTVDGDDTGTLLEINNSSGFDTYFDNGTIVQFDACNNSFSFPDGDPLIALFAFHLTAESSYDEGAVKSMTGRGNMVAGASNYGPYEFILTKQ